MSTETKPTNPKDMIGSKKLAMHLVPSVVQSYAALAFTEGALKYGKYNWRVAGVRVSIYLDAIGRHLAAYQNGEWADKATRVPHLASILACVGIILDAGVSGKLTDDRPPAQPGLKHLIDFEMQAITRHLQDLFKHHSPHHHTITDETHDDTRRKSEKAGRQPVEESRSLQAQAGAKRHGRASAGLPRRASRVLRKRRNKG